MVNKIEIQINNNLYIIKEKEKIEILLRIIRNFKKQTNKINYLDSEKYYIKIYTQNEKVEYQGQGIDQKYYIALKEIIGDKYV